MDQPTPPSKAQQMIDIMRSEGYTDEQMIEISAELSKNAYAQLYTEAMAAFTEEDMSAIDACATDEEANQKILELYKLRTGQDPEQQVQQFIELFAQNFLDEYAKAQQAPDSQDSNSAQLTVSPSDTSAEQPSMSQPSTDQASPDPIAPVDTPAPTNEAPIPPTVTEQPQPDQIPPNQSTQNPQSEDESVGS